MYQTKTGIVLTVIQGLGQGDGVPCGRLSLVTELTKPIERQVKASRPKRVKRQIVGPFVSQAEHDSWLNWVDSLFVSK